MPTMPVLCLFITIAMQTTKFALLGTQQVTIFIGNTISELSCTCTPLKVQLKNRPIYNELASSASIAQQGFQSLLSGW